MSSHGTTPDDGRGDGGFSLVELLVAMGIFTGLMALVTGVFISGVHATQDVSANANLQQEQQSAVEWMSKLLRYTDNPSESSNPPAAIDYAGSSSMTFYTFAGVGPIDRVPYKATLTTNSLGVISQVWSPVMVAGLPTYPSAPMTRVIVESSPTHTPTLAFQYWSTTGGIDTVLTPPVNGSLTAAQAKSISKVSVALSDSGHVQAAQQTVLLVNPR